MLQVDMCHGAAASNEESFLPAIIECIDDLSNELRRISLEIHDNPELQYKEFQSVHGTPEDTSMQGN